MVLGYVLLKFVQMVVPPRLGFCAIKVRSSGYNNNVKLYNITIIVHYNVLQVSIRPVGLVSKTFLVLCKYRTSPL